MIRGSDVVSQIFRKKENEASPKNQTWTTSSAMIAGLITEMQTQIGPATYMLQEPRKPNQAQ
jgi:hypothetical protein